MYVSYYLIFINGAPRCSASFILFKKFIKLFGEEKQKEIISKVKSQSDGGLSILARLCKREVVGRFIGSDDRAN